MRTNLNQHNRACQLLERAGFFYNSLVGCHGVSGATWSRATIPESAGLCRRPAQSSPTSVSIVTLTARVTIPANNCRSLHHSFGTHCHPTSKHLFLCLPSVNALKHVFASLFLTLSFDHTTPSWSMQ